MATKNPDPAEDKVRVHLAKTYWPTLEEWADLTQETGMDPETMKQRIAPDQVPDGGMLMTRENANRLYQAGVVKIDSPFSLQQPSDPAPEGGEE